MNDDELRSRFLELRDFDRRTAPAFVRPHARKRTSPVWIAGAIALAAAVLLAVWAFPREPERVAAPSFAQSEPLGFLLSPPSASVLTSVEPFDRALEVW